MKFQPSQAHQDFEDVRCLGIPLVEKLNAYAQLQRKNQVAVTALYHDLLQRMASGDAGQNAPDVGDRFEGFHLPNSQGQMVRFDDLVRSGPLVVSFNRGSWCPYCRLELLALAEIQPKVKALGGEIVSIIPETGKSTQKLRGAYDLPFPVLSDMDNASALALGLMIFLGPDLRQALLHYNVDLTALHGNEGLFLPITATYVIGRDGIVKDAFVDPDFRQRMPPERVIAALKDM